MKKLLELESCSECKHHRYYPHHADTCCCHPEITSEAKYHVWGRDLDAEDYDDFPVWCPLVDKQPSKS